MLRQTAINKSNIVNIIRNYMKVSMEIISRRLPACFMMTWLAVAGMGSARAGKHRLLDRPGWQ